jgi:hypothetical protein
MARYIKTEDAIPYLTKYIPSVEAVEREKIDKAIEEMENISQSAHLTRGDIKRMCIEILKRNIGE